jgi:hypothetical protein
MDIVEKILCEICSGNGGIMVLIREDIVGAAVAEEDRLVCFSTLRQLPL